MNRIDIIDLIDEAASKLDKVATEGDRHLHLAELRTVVDVVAKLRKLVDALNSRSDE